MAEPALPPDLAARLRQAVVEADNPVGAMRAVRRVVADLPSRYAGERDAIRWAAEKALRPYWRDLEGDQAAKAATWAALDGIFDAAAADRLENADGEDRNRANPIKAAAARVREAMFR